MKQTKKGARSRPRARSPKTDSRTPPKTRPRYVDSGPLTLTLSSASRLAAAPASPSLTSIPARLASLLKSGYLKIRALF